MQQRQVRPIKSASGVELVYIGVLNTAAVCAAPFVYLSSVGRACTRACSNQGTAQPQCGSGLLFVTLL